jgi:hypothetical protein
MIPLRSTTTQNQRNDAGKEQEKAKSTRGPLEDGGQISTPAIAI